MKINYFTIQTKRLGKLCKLKQLIAEMSTERSVIFTPEAPAAVGPYSQAVLHGKTLYVSGVLGLDKDTMKMVPGGASAQAERALTTLGHILKCGGSSYDNVLKTTIFLNNIEDFQGINEIYKKFFTKDFPARSTFQVGKLPLGAEVEIEAIAAVP